LFAVVFSVYSCPHNAIAGDADVTTDTAPGRLAYSVKEAATLAGLSHHTLYRAINAGQLVPKRMGSRTLILADRLKAFLDGLEDVTKPGRGPNSKR
jgi:excisionase family DNA binding protein